MFIHSTFYRNRKSPIYFVLGLVLLAFFVDIYALLTNNLNLAGLVTAIGLVNWTWHFFVARSAYIQIANDESVENWVKARYRLMIVYIPMMMLITLQVIVSSTTFIPSMPRILVLAGLLIIIASLILQFLVWVMPEPFRLWLNRTQLARPAHEEQNPRSLLDVFGAAMTTETGLNSMTCLYAIRSTVSKKISSEDSTTIRHKIDTMTYAEWETILQHPELQRILINGGANQASATKAIENARQALVEKQSLLTLSTH